MPELPDITLYIEAANGAIVTAAERLGKRVARGFRNEIWAVIHLMVAGRFQWLPAWPERVNKQTALTRKRDLERLKP